MSFVDVARPRLAAAGLRRRGPPARSLLVMALAIWRSWGTHYDAPPPGFPAPRRWRRWLWTGLLPQTTIWVAFTLAVGHGVRRGRGLPGSRPALTRHDAPGLDPGAIMSATGWCSTGWKGERVLRDPDLP